MARHGEYVEGVARSGDAVLVSWDIVRKNLREAE